MAEPNTAYDLWLEGVDESRLADYPSAIEKFKKSVELDHTFKRSYESWAEALLNTENPDAALAELQREIETYFDKATAHYIIGNAYVRLNKYEKAIEAFKQAIEQDNSLTEVHINCGLAYANLGQYDNAIACYQEALKQDPHSADSYSNWGRALEAQSDYPGAIEKYKQALQADPNEFNALVNWSTILLKLPEPEAALEDFRQTIEKDVATVDGFFRLGEILFELKRYREAIAEYKRIIELEPKYANVYINCGYSYDKLGEYDKAIEYYQKAIEVDPDAALSYNNWGWVLDEQGDYPAAIEKYKQALQRNPNEVTAINNWAQTIAKLPNPDAELADFRTVIEKDFPNADGYNALGYLLLKLEKNSDAIEIFQRALELDPKSDNAYINIGLAYDRLGEFDKAIDCYQKAIAIDPYSVISFNNWGWVLNEQGDYPGAIEKYKQALHINPKYEQSLINWAGALEKLPKPEAESEFQALRQTIETDFANPDGYSLLANSLFELERYAEAVAEYEHIIALDPKYSNAYINAGLAYDKLRDYKKAIRYYRKAIAINPDSAITYSNWGWVLNEQKNYTAAIVKFKKSLQCDPKYRQALINWLSVIKHLPQPDAELAAVSEVIDRDFSNAESYNNLGYVLLELRQYDKALPNLQRAVRLDSNSADAQTNLGVALQYTGDVAAAIEASEQALKIRSDYPIALYHLGSQYIQIGETEKAISCYKRAIHADPNYEPAYFGWSDNITKANNPGAELKTFTSTVLDKFNTAHGDNLIGATLYYSFNRYEEARTYFTKAIQRDPGIADAYFNLGNVLRDMYMYDSAIEKIEEALKIRVHSYYIHNHADILQKQGRYREAKRKWSEAVDAYLRCEQDTESPPDTWFYLYYGSICQDVFKDYASAEQAFEMSLKIDINNYAAHVALAKLYLEQKENAISDSMEDRKIRNQCNFKAWNAYRQAKKLIALKNKGDRDTDTMLDLVELYILFDKHEDADEYLKQVRKLEPDNVRALMSSGIVAMKLEHYNDAMKYYKAAFDQDPDNLNARANLARAYQKLKRNLEAENEYQKILSTTGCHVDALFGLSEVYLAEAENADTKGNTGDAVVYFNKAIHELNKLLEYTDPPAVHLPKIPKQILQSTISRALTKNEISSIFYMLGFAKTKLCEARKFSNRTLLHQAAKDFKQVKFGTPNYFKAERARTKLEELSETLNRSGSGTSTKVVALLALVIFLLAQFGFFVGKPVIGYANLSVNHAALDTLLKTAKVDTQKYQTEIQTLKSSTFVQEQQITALVKAMLGKAQLESMQLADLIQHSGKLQLKGFEKMGDTTYALLTFGSLIFMVAGLFLREITKLKFGGVELEKASIDQVGIVTSLNITVSSGDHDIVAYHPITGRTASGGLRPSSTGPSASTVSVAPRS